MSPLFEQINERAHDPKRAIDEGTGATDAKGKPSAFVAQLIASEAQVREAEVRLGFLLPPLLRQLYTQVGNGGFGPGYGILGLPEVGVEDPASMVDKYLALRKAEGGRLWPERLLPLCIWGSDIESSLECAKPEMPVIRHDPNMERSQVAERVPKEKHFFRSNQVKGACWVEAVSFESWLQAWVDGKNLFYLGYGEPEDDNEEELDEDEVSEV